MVISALSLFVALGTLLWSRHTWRVERKSDVRVVARNDASGLDIYADRMEVQLVIAVRVFNHGENRSTSCGPDWSPSPASRY